MLATKAQKDAEALARFAEVVQLRKEREEAVRQAQKEQVCGCNCCTCM